MKLVVASQGERAALMVHFTQDELGELARRFGTNPRFKHVVSPEYGTITFTASAEAGVSLEKKRLYKRVYVILRIQSKKYRDIVNKGQYEASPTWRDTGFTVQVKGDLFDMAGNKEAVKNRPDSVFTPTYRSEDGRSTPMISCKCSHCGETESKKGTNTVPTSVIAEQFRSKGWYVANKETYSLCPKCIKNEEEKKEVVKEVSQSGEAMRRQKKLYDILDAHFDVEKGAYEEGWDDKAVAVATELSESYVVKVREEVYGPLKMNPELVALGSEIELMRKTIEREAREMRDLVEANISSMIEKLVGLERRFSAMVTKR